MRSAPSKERVLALVSVAEEIEKSSGGSGLGDWVRSQARADLAKRGPLAASYAKLAANPGSFTPQQIDQLLAQLRKAKQDDLVLGVLVLTGRVASARADVRHIAELTRDPWALTLADEADAQAALTKGDAVDARQILVDADQRCLAARIDYRCAFLEYDLAEALLRLEKPGEAREQAMTGLLRARAAGVDARDLERRYFVLLAEIARARNLPSLAAAYVAEARLRMP